MRIGKSNAFLPPHRREGTHWAAYAPKSPAASQARQWLVSFAGRHQATGQLMWLTVRQKCRLNFLYRRPFLVQHHLRRCTESIVAMEKGKRVGYEAASQCIQCRVR
jgi:hypothetical protein